MCVCLRDWKHLQSTASMNVVHWHLDQSPRIRVWVLTAELIKYTSYCQILHLLWTSSYTEVRYPLGPWYIVVSSKRTKPTIKSQAYTIEVVDFTFFAFFRREHFSIGLLGPLEYKSKVGTRKPCSKIMHGSIKVIVVMLFSGDPPRIAVKSVLLVKCIRFWLETQLFPCPLRH